MSPLTYSAAAAASLPAAGPSPAGPPPPDWGEIVNAFGNRGLTNNSTALLFTLGLVACIVTAVLALRWYAYAATRSYYSPRAMFRELCRAHGLSWGESWLLSRLAKAYRLAQPAQLFLEPDLFAAPRLPALFEPRSERLLALRKRIFACRNAGTSAWPFAGDEADLSARVR